MSQLKPTDAAQLREFVASSVAEAQPRDLDEPALGVDAQAFNEAPQADYVGKTPVTLDELDPDGVEERTVRAAWAAARSDVEREMDGNAILQAIEAAERDLLLPPPAPAQAALDSSLDEELLHPPQRPRKAAA